VTQASSTTHAATLASLALLATACGTDAASTHVPAPPTIGPSWQRSAASARVRSRVTTATRSRYQGSTRTPPPKPVARGRNRAYRNRLIASINASRARFGFTSDSPCGQVFG
jgi:hypothetical protein